MACDGRSNTNGLRGPFRKVYEMKTESNGWEDGARCAESVSMLHDTMDGRWLRLDGSSKAPAPYMKWRLPADHAKEHTKKASEAKLATTSEAIAHIGNGGLLGVHPANIGLVVFDIDNRKVDGRWQKATKDNPISKSECAAFFAEHPPVISVSSAKGVHAYYDAPDGVHIANGFWASHGLGGEIRGHDGYVVAWDIPWLAYVPEHQAMDRRLYGPEIDAVSGKWDTDSKGNLAFVRAVESSLPSMSDNQTRQANGSDVFSCDDNAAKYTEAVCGAVAGAYEGTRNDTVFRKAFLVSSKCGPHIDESKLRAMVLEAAVASGLSRREAIVAVNSGWSGGADVRQPYVPRDTADGYVSELTVVGDVEEDEEDEETLEDIMEELGIESSVKFVARDFPDYDWVWNGLLRRGGISILHGGPKDGKSTLARDLASCVSDPEIDEFLGRSVATGRVIYMALEEGFKDFQEQLAVLGPNDNLDVKVGRLADSTMQKLPILLKGMGTSLLVVDTMQKMVRADDSNDYSEMTLAVEVLEIIARETDCHIMIVHHSNKSTSSRSSGDTIDVIEGAMGSTGITGGVDVVFLLKRGEVDSFIKAEGRNGMELEKKVLEFNPHSLRFSLRGSIEEIKDDRTRREIIRCLEDPETPRESDGLVTAGMIRSIVAGRDEDRVRVLAEMVADNTVIEVGIARSKTDKLRYGMRSEFFTH